jgi:hypothetical protein
MGATGTTTIDFGAFPGKSDASVAVTGQAAIVSGSLVEAWIRPVDSADHLADEHLVEHIKIVAGNIVAGTGFTIYAFNVTPQIPGSDDIDGNYTSQPTNSTRLYGVWNVNWAWA